MIWGSIQALISTIKDALFFVDRNSAEHDKLVEALVSIQTAIIATQNFINAHGYVANPELSTLWLTAYAKINRANIFNGERNADWFYDKARFWGDPQTWMNEPGAMELVPDLSQLEQICDNIRVQLN